jgi:hypothetical protein
MGSPGCLRVLTQRLKAGIVEPEETAVASGLFKMTDAFPCRRGGPIFKHINGLGKNKKFGHESRREQKAKNDCIDEGQLQLTVMLCD